MRPALATCLAFLAAASATTQEITLVAYLGGAGTDDCDGITLDRSGDIYLACHSDSPDFPHLPAKASRGPRDMDAVVLKIAAGTGRILWATRTGGSQWDAAGDLEVGKDGSDQPCWARRNPPTSPRLRTQYNVNSGDRVAMWFC